MRAKLKLSNSTSILLLLLFFTKKKKKEKCNPLLPNYKQCTPQTR